MNNCLETASYAKLNVTI